MKKKKAIYSLRVHIITSNLTSEALIAIMEGSKYSKSSKIDKAIKASEKHFGAGGSKPSNEFVPHCKTV